MSEPSNYRELAEKPGMLMYSGESRIIRGTNPADYIYSHGVVHFIFNTITDESGTHQAVIVDSNFEILTNKVLFFASVDEFFALASYMMRNGIVVSQ